MIDELLADVSQFGRTDPASWHPIRFAHAPERGQGLDLESRLQHPSPAGAGQILQWWQLPAQSV
jgi:hypothetical protein